jgi:hypothetical protein
LSLSANADFGWKRKLYLVIIWLSFEPYYLPHSSYQWARAKSSPEFVHNRDSDDPETQSDSQATVLSCSLTSEASWEGTASSKPVVTAMQAPKAKWKHTNHYLNSKDTDTVTETPFVSYFTLICIQPGLCGNQTTHLFHPKSAHWLTSSMQTAVKEASLWTDWNTWLPFWVEAWHTAKRVTGLSQIFQILKLNLMLTTTSFALLIRVTSIVSPSLNLEIAVLFKHSFVLSQISTQSLSGSVWNTQWQNDFSLAIKRLVNNCDCAGSKLDSLLYVSLA